MFKRIRYKIMMVIGLALTVGLVVTAAFYTYYQEQSVLAQNERTMLKLTESVTQGLQSVMLAGSADIAQAFADRLKLVPEVLEFSVMRANGLEAFRDNKTIDDVNARRGEEMFLPRESEAERRILAADDSALRETLTSRVPKAIYGMGSDGARTLTFIAPILNGDGCYKCHGKANPVRGLLKITTSLAPVERDILKARQQSLLVLGSVLMATMLLTGYMMGRTVVNPIERVTRAMARVSGGDLEHQVISQGQDELGRMARSFNVMTSELKQTYDGLRREQDKLTTIIRSAGEGIVVTDSHGRVVLVNPAAERLLGKTVDQIVEGGLMTLLDDPDTMANWLAQEERKGPATLPFGPYVLQVFASTIHGKDGKVVGSAVLLRNITDEKRLEEELRRLSTTDGLTSLYNRRHLDETLAKELQRATRATLPLSVVMFDIDHFKRFNDTHGHDQGDRVLQSVARVFAESLRKYDLACRYGGEEFVGILPNTNSEGAMRVAERVRREVEETQVDGLSVTISLGVATYPDLDVANPEQLVELADKAMYRSKQGGRNRVSMATAEDRSVAGVTG